jgi:hypothetical protein
MDTATQHTFSEGDKVTWTEYRSVSSRRGTTMNISTKRGVIMSIANGKALVKRQGGRVITEKLSNLTPADEPSALTKAWQRAADAVLKATAKEGA